MSGIKIVAHEMYFAAMYSARRSSARRHQTMVGWGKQAIL